jgi:D-arabinose 1-dehydrogenase-like Zn-dependent alcohol dehydrogenase
MQWVQLNNKKERNSFPMSTSTIQAIRVHQYGGPEQLKLEQIARPEPQADEVLVRVYAAGVAPADWKTRQGLMKDLRPMQLPYIPGSALAGIELCQTGHGRGRIVLHIADEPYGG